MKRRISFLVVVFFVLSIFTTQGEILAAPYYEGKTIIIVVGFGVGGGYDRMTRLIAKYLPKYIPGKPTIIIDNMPGAGSIIAANRIYNLEKPDGLTLGCINRGIPYSQLLKATGVKFDLRKFSWIGSAGSEATVLAIRADLPYKTFDELRKAKEPIHMGATGLAANDTQFTLLAKEFIGLNAKIVTYSAIPELMLAVERKEVDGRSGTYSSLKPFIERGLLRPLLRGRVAEPGIENLPVNEDLTTDKMAKTIMAMQSYPDRMGRPYVATPGTPPEIMKIMKDAFMRASKDSALIEESRKMKMDFEYVPAEECLKVVNFVLNQPEDIVKEFGKYIKF
jgi:tripartite-type tricarboxylate transporter receptor subunit TctC